MCWKFTVYLIVPMGMLTMTYDWLMLASVVLRLRGVIALKEHFELCFLFALKYL